MDSTATGRPCVCILWQGGVLCPVSAAWHFCVAAHWSKYHCYNQAPSWYDLRCFKATLNPNKQTNRNLHLYIQVQSWTIVIVDECTAIRSSRTVNVAFKAHCGLAVNTRTVFAFVPPQGCESILQSKGYCLLVKNLSLAPKIAVRITEDEICNNALFYTKLARQRSINVRISVIYLDLLYDYILLRKRNVKFGLPADRFYCRIWIKMVWFNPL